MKSYWDRLAAQKAQQISDYLDNNIEPLLKKLKEKHHLDRAQISKRHWGSPDISFRWEDDDGMGRSLHLIFDQGSELVALEVSAWKDDKAKGERRWGQESIVSLKVPDELSQLEEHLEKAYSKVASWKDLGKEDKLTPNAMSWLKGELK